MSNNEKQSIKMSKGVYVKAKKMLEEKGGKFIDYIDNLVSIDLVRDNFLKMAYPMIKTEHISEDAIYVRDSKNNKSAVVQIKEYEDSDLDNSGFYAYCETDKSDTCVHVRYCLASDSAIQLYTLSRKASMQ